jgi:uncharacterized membrane protein
MLYVAGNVLIVLAAVVAVSSVVVYQVRARWWDNPTGRHLFSYMSVIGLALSLWAGRLATSPGVWTAQSGGDSCWHVIRLVVFVLINWVLIWRLVLLLRAQADAERRRIREERQR